MNCVIHQAKIVAPFVTERMNGMKELNWIPLRTTGIWRAHHALDCQLVMRCVNSISCANYIQIRSFLKN